MLHVPDSIPLESRLWPGGSPADDRAYLAWRDNFLACAGEWLIATRWHDAPQCEPPSAYSLDWHLMTSLGHASPADGGLENWNYAHRIRRLAVAYRDNPSGIEAAAWDYFVSITED